jgi:hypothetical protein
VDDEGWGTDVAGRSSVHSRGGRDQRASTCDGRRLRRSPVRLGCIGAAKDLPYAKWRSQLAATSLRVSLQRIPRRSCVRQSTRGLRFMRRAASHSDAVPVIPLHSQRRHALASPPRKDPRRPHSPRRSANWTHSVRVCLAAGHFPARRADFALHGRHRFRPGDELALLARRLRAPAPPRPDPDGRPRSSLAAAIGAPPQPRLRVVGDSASGR